VGWPGDGKPRSASQRVCSSWESGLSVALIQKTEISMGSLKICADRSAQKLQRLQGINPMGITVDQLSEANDDVGASPVPAVADVLGDSNRHQHTLIRLHVSELTLGYHKAKFYCCFHGNECCESLSSPACRELELK
jgi:hypothetical protein